MTQAPTRHEQIAENARAAKARRQVTDEQIAAALGMPRTAVNDRMKGRVRWQIDELEALSAFLDVPLAQLLAPAVEVSA